MKSIQTIYNNNRAYGSGAIATYKPQSSPKFIIQMPPGDIYPVALTGI